MSDRRHWDVIIEAVETESDAFDLMYAIRKKFGMVGTEFCRTDVEMAWDIHCAHNDVNVDFSDDHWDAVLNSRNWLRAMQDTMVEAGNDIIENFLIPELHIKGDSK